MYPYDSDTSYEIFTKELAVNEAAATDEPQEDVVAELTEEAADAQVVAQDHGRGRRGGSDHGRDNHRRDDRRDDRFDDRDYGRGRGGRGHSRPPGAPPRHIPSEPKALRSVDARAISRCLNNFMYVWLTFGNGFWMYPTFVGPRSVAGYRWGRFGWSYTGFDIRAVKAFTCL